MTWGQGRKAETRITHVVNTTGGLSYHGRLVEETDTAVVITTGTYDERHVIPRRNIRQIVTFTQEKPS